MALKMPDPNSSLSELFSDATIFADVFNSVLFNNRMVVNPEELETEDSAYTSAITINKGNKKISVEKINKYRDIVRKTPIGNLVILGIENQDKIHYAMPVRKMLYDALSYSSELSAISKTEDKNGWTVDEFLSKVRKETKVTPVITVVFYTGKNPWNGPRSLHDMMDMDKQIKKYVPDYPLHIIDIGHDDDISFSNKDLEDLRRMLRSVYSGSSNSLNSVAKNSIISLAGILANDLNLYNIAKSMKGDEANMESAFAERDAKIFAAKDAEIAAKTAEIADKDAKIADKEAEIADKDAKIAAAYEEIEKLKKMLAAGK